MNKCDIICERIEKNYHDTEMTAQEFWAAFQQYAEREANNICTARIRRNNKISEIVTRVMTATIAVSSVIAVIITVL